MVWGHTFQTADKTRNMIGDVAPEYDALVARLNERLPDRLQDEANPTARAQIFGFPSQMATLKRSITDFLGRVFEPTRYHANATLRGFYFTSGTQEGTPIDQLIGALSRSFGSSHASAGAYSGRGKSYFLTDLIQKVIIGEAGWVSTDLGAARRATLLRAAGFATVALVSLAALGLWWTSFSRNSDLITATNYGLSDYRASAAPVLQETTISERNFSRVLPLLHKLRHLPTGYATREEPTPVAATFGLSQRDRLQNAAELTYQQALERMLRSRIIFRLEEQLEANQANPGFVYEALKVYMMVGGQAKLDRDLVIAWMRLDWAENLFPGAANAKGREALEEHLVAMLDLDDGEAEPLVKLNQSLIENSQRTLRRLSIAERAYELLRTQARSQSQRDWVAARRGGSDVRLAFEGVGGEDLDAIRVPYFYTYDGFQNAFVDRLGDIGDRIEKERWVLGENVDQQAIVSQYATLFQDLLKLYSRDFVASWQRTLARLKLRPLNADKPQYVALSAMAAPTSPFKQILESVRDETQLTKERASAKKAAAQAASNALEKRASDALSRLGTNLPLSAPGVERVLGAGGNEALGADIEAQFKPFHVLVEGDLGRRPVDQLLQVLSEINQNLAIAATNPAQAAAANAALVPLIATLRANSSRYPAPFGAMVVSAVNDFEGDATGATVALLRQALAKGELQLYYQPIMELATGVLYGAEALLRWNSFDLGMVGPDKFIPIAEERGMIVEIGRWVIREGCRTAVAWNAMRSQPYVLAINLSSRQFMQQDFLTMITDCLQETGCHPQWLKFEITESLLLHDSDHIRQTLEALHSIGIAIAIDDFGTGYSALGYLNKFPVSQVKIDRSFISDIATNTESALLVKAIVAMADSLGKDLVAEGVETAEQAEILAQLGCQYVQGYYYGRPVPLETFQQSLR